MSSHVVADLPSMVRSEDHVWPAVTADRKAAHVCSSPNAEITPGTAGVLFTKQMSSRDAPQ